jgi:hypothetical protein
MTRKRSEPPGPLEHRFLDLLQLTNSQLAALVRDLQNRFDCGNLSGEQVLKALGVIASARKILASRGLDDVAIEFLFSGKNHA